MKKIISSILLAIVTMACSAQDATFYQAKEWNIDLFGAGKYPATGGHFLDDGRYGAGIGAAYFITRNIAVGGSAQSDNTGHSFIDQSQLDLVGRLPFGNSQFAGYGKFGVGYEFELRDAFVHEGIGLEYRFTRNIGSFAEAEWVSGISTPDRMIGRFGLRISFR